MATKFRLRRSATADKRPVESDLLLGELALNTYDGRLYTKRDTNNVGIADTAALLTPWTENFGGESIYYSNSVGIGTTNPETRLHVSDGHLASANDFDSNVVLAISKNTTTSSWAGLALNSGNAAGAFIHFGDTDDSNVGRLDYNHTDNCFSFFTNGNAAEKLRIDSSGRIGLGIANPDAYFSSYNRVVMGRTNDTGGMTIVSSTASGGYISFADGTSGNQAYRGIIAYQHNGDYMTFGTDGGTERLRIDSSGYVGINTTVMSNSERVAVRLNDDDLFELRSHAQELFQVWKEGSTEECRLNLKHNGSTKIHLRGNGKSYFNGGNVGIGSEIPDYMLDVSGAINSETDVKVGGVSVSETALNDAVAMAIALG